MNKIYPFKFLDSYDKNDADLFFGRDEEIKLLYEMVFQTDILLVYGASGTGKTSLIQCGLASKFQSHDWLPLSIRRGSNINQSFEKILQDAGGKTETTEIDNDFDWLDNLDGNNVPIEKIKPIAQLFKNIYLKHFRPIYLIFDQFEELYILGSKEEQNQFIETVNQVLKLEQPVKMIFSIREEYLGYLYEFERAVPQLLRKKLRVEPMNLDRVSQVIVGATTHENSIISLKKAETEELTRQIFEKIKGKSKSLTIQLPYLQVFLDKLYLKITNDRKREQEATFTLAALSQMKEIEDVLRDFLEEQVKENSRKLIKTHSELTEENIWKILSPFVTLEKTKEPITEKELFNRLSISENAIHATLDALINSRIIRYNEDGELYEIAHDALALQIASKRSDDEIALLEIRRLINSQTSLNEDARELLTEKQLGFIEPFLIKLREQSLIDKKGEALITTSQAKIAKNKAIEKAEQKKELAKAQRQAEKERNLSRRAYYVAAVAVAIAVLAGVFYLQAQDATRQAKIETENTQNALNLANQKEKERKTIQAEKDANEFKALESRAINILDVGGCPIDILNKMEAISMRYQEIIRYQNIIKTLRLRQTNPECQQ